MTPRERLDAIAAGRVPDRRPFVPSIYEHGAALLSRTPTAVSRDAALMAEAALEAYETYQHDIVTVGIDIYNVEAEAFGCAISRHDEAHAIPGVISHPLQGSDGLAPEDLPIPQPNATNRLGLLADACSRVVESIGDDVWVTGCMAGPFSQAVELRSFDDLIVDAFTEPDRVHRLLARTTQLAIEQADRISRTGAGVYLYESWATMPLIDPRLFATYVVPYNRQVIRHVRERFDTPAPAVVMGGDISLLIDFFVEAESGLVVCDYNADFGLIRERTAGRDMLVRGCVDPKAIERGDWGAISTATDTLARKAAGMNNFLWGCGCVSYDTTVEQVLEFKERCRAAGRMG